ncbi:MAG: DUF6580 family putative transport protein [Pseudomonadota bacterium]
MTFSPATRTAAIILGLVVLGAVARIAPHAPNVSPIAAIALFAAFATGRAGLGAAAAGGAMLLSDLVIGGHEPGVMASVYLALLAPAFLGPLLRRLDGEIALVAGAGASAIGASVLFFLLTNAAHWAFTQMYPPTLEGLAASYTAAIPFFRATLAGDLLWTAAIFGAAACWDQLRLPRPRAVR